MHIAWYNSTAMCGIYIIYIYYVPFLVCGWKIKPIDGKILLILALKAAGTLHVDIVITFLKGFL